jgi:hypothetical protein
LKVKKPSKELLKLLKENLINKEPLRSFVKENPIRNLLRKEEKKLGKLFVEMSGLELMKMTNLFYCPKCGSKNVATIYSVPVGKVYTPPTLT